MKKKLIKEDKLYTKSMDEWLKRVRLCIKRSKNDIVCLQKMVAIETKKKRLEIQRADIGIRDYNVWRKEEGLKPIKLLTEKEK